MYVYIYIPFNLMIFFYKTLYMVDGIQLFIFNERNTLKSPALPWLPTLTM